MGVEYSRSLMKSLFYFILFGLTMIYILYNFSWKKVEKIVVQNHDPKNHDQIHEQFDLIDIVISWLYMIKYVLMIKYIGS